MDSKTTLGDLGERVSFSKAIIERGYSSSKLGFKNLEQVASDYDKMKNSGVSKRTTGFIQIDHYLSEGFKDGQITTVAALASAGKSSLCLSIMKNLSQLEQPVPVAQFALEMNNTSLFTKLLSFRTRLPISTIVKKPEDLSVDELQIYEWEKEQLAQNKHIFLNDKPTQSLASIREQILLLQDLIRQQYVVVVIDLFGKLSDLQSSDNFARAYEQKLNEIQVLVRELGVHMILVAQLNREVGKKNRRPTMNDLKNSHALTEVSDIIMGIHRPHYDSEKKFKQHLMYGTPLDGVDDFDMDDSQIIRDPNQDIAEVIILKQRMGPKDVLINFTFDPITTCFYPITEQRQHELNLMKIEEEDE
jgi:replicative DNA helicase